MVLDQDEAGSVAEILECGQCGFKDGDRIGRPPTIDHGSTPQADGARLILAPAEVVPDGSRLDEPRLCDLRVAAGVGRHPSLLEQIRPVGRVARDLERLEEEHGGLVMAAEGGGALGGTAQGEPRLCREGLALGVIARRAICSQVVRGERTGQLIFAQTLEEPRRRQMPAPPIALGQRPVCHLADERLDERVLAAFGRSRIDVVDEQLAPDERTEAGVEALGVEAADGREARQGKALSEDRRITDERSIGRVECVEAGCDECLERCRDRQISDVDGADRARRDEHPDGLHRVQRDPVGPDDDGRPAIGRDARSQRREDLAHRVVGEGLEGEPDEGPPTCPPPRPTFDQLGPGQGDDGQRDTRAPVQHMIDEVEQAVVSPVEVLEHEDDRPGRRDPLEERAPGAEQLLAGSAGAALEAEQHEQCVFDPAAFGLVGNPLPDPGGHRSPRRGLIVALDQADPPADHLAECPERDALAICG